MSDLVHIGTVPKNRTEEVRVGLSDFRGRNLVDVRVYAAIGATGRSEPTKKGISVAVERLPELIAALTEAKAEAERRGLLGRAEE